MSRPSGSAYFQLTLTRAEAIELEKVLFTCEAKSKRAMEIQDRVRQRISDHLAAQEASHAKQEAPDAAE